MPMDRERESLALNSELTDPALALVVAARTAEAARNAALSAGQDAPDTADSAIHAACEAVPTTLAGIVAKLAMLLDLEAPNLSAETALTIRAVLASPVLAVPKA